MKTPQNQGPIDVLAQVYEKLFESVVKNFHNTEEKSGTLLHKLIDEAGCDGAGIFSGSKVCRKFLVPAF